MVQSDFLKHALYISDNDNTAKIIEGALKRCGVKSLSRVRNVAEGIDFVFKNKTLTHYVVEDITIFEHYHFFPVQILSSSYRFKVPPPCFAICKADDSLDLKLLKAARYVDYVVEPLNESLLEQRIRASYLKSYQYQCSGILGTAIETLLNNKETEKALLLALPAFARVPKNSENTMLLAKIYFELKEMKFAELAVKFLIAQNKNNLSAKNMLMKILLASGRVKEANKLKF